MQSRTARTIRMHDPKIKRDLNYVSGRRGASWHVNAGNYLAHDGHSLALWASHAIPASPLPTHVVPMPGRIYTHGRRGEGVAASPAALRTRGNDQTWPRDQGHSPTCPAEASSNSMPDAASRTSPQSPSASTERLQRAGPFRHCCPALSG